MAPKAALIIVAAVIAAAALSACGGTGDAHAAFVGDANAICKTANDKEGALGAEGPGWMYGEQSTTPGSSRRSPTRGGWRSLSSRSSACLPRTGHGQRP